MFSGWLAVEACGGFAPVVLAVASHYGFDPVVLAVVLAMVSLQWSLGWLRSSRARSGVRKSLLPAVVGVALFDVALFDFDAVVSWM